MPFVYKSVEWWRTIHPQTTVVPTLTPDNAWAVAVLRIAFMLLFGVLLTARVALEDRRGELDDLYLADEDRR